MANKLVQQKLVDTNKRALIKYIFISDGTVNTNSVLVDVSQLNYALNANGQIMVSDTDQRDSYSTSVKRIFGAGNFSGSGYVKLQWQGDSNSEIVIIPSTSFNFEMSSITGEVSVITNPEANTNGDILFSTVNVSANDTMTLFIELRKDSRDYDAGQTADPVAFNRG